MSNFGENRPVVAVDIDEVLALFIPALVDFHNEKYESNLTPDAFFSYEFFEVWGGTQAETATKFREHLAPVNGAFEALMKLKKHFDLHIVTSRQNKVRNDTFQWIDRHFPGVFSDIHLGNHYSNEGKSRTKSEICHSIGACILIDDSLKYAIQCVHDNVPVILFGNYAWNQVKSVPDDIRFLQYQKGMSIEANDSIFNKISSDINASLVERYKLTRGSGSHYNVYRVLNWDDVVELVLKSFALNN